MPKIINPILPGFNPDPSILRVEDDYYIATSTFEWFPGVQIHHSKDLVNWELIAHPLNRISQLNMSGNPSSGGIWAPCLTYDKGTFYLIYTDVKSLYGGFKDTHNYMVTATDICGEWSDPIYMNSSGFDPSLFHDEDGKKWFINMLWDHRPRKHSFGGILLQEYSVEEKKLVGPIYNIFKGTELRVTEGPHLYKINGWYYLITAEGGTGIEHAVTLARSKSIFGPYEVHPENPILCARHNPLLPLQKTGHASIVETQNGQWYMVHLCGRPIPTKGRCTLGRETAIQKVAWGEDGWLRLAEGGNEGFVEVETPNLPEFKPTKAPTRDNFDSDLLNIHFQTLRVPLGEDSLSLKERPGYLRLKGRESLSSKHNQSLVARRWQAFRFTAETCVEFEPETFQQMAGLICYYDNENYYYIRVSWDEKLGKSLGIISCQNNDFKEPLDQEVALQGVDRVYLKVTVDYDLMQFHYSIDGSSWSKLGGLFDASTLSDEFCREGWFTGAFVGICCQDLSGRRKHADFDYFEYIER